MTLRQARPWIYLLAFVTGTALLAKGTLVSPWLAAAYRSSLLIVILLLSVAKMFQWWKVQRNFRNASNGFTDRLFRRQLSLQKKALRWFYDERH